MTWRFGSGLFVIPNHVLNLALKQVQGLSNSIYDFSISFLGLVISVLKPHSVGEAFFTVLTRNVFFHIFNSP